MLMRRLNGMLECGERHRQLKATCMTLVEQVRKSSKTPLLSCLLEGPSGRSATAQAVAHTITVSCIRCADRNLPLTRFLLPFVGDWLARCSGLLGACRYSFWPSRWKHKVR